MSLDGKPGSKDELKVSEHLNIEKDGSTPKTRKVSYYPKLRSILVLHLKVHTFTQEEECTVPHTLYINM